MIFVAQNIIIFDPNFWLKSCCVKNILVEFTMILSLLEILFSHLRLFLIINVCSMFHKGYMCVASLVDVHTIILKERLNSLFDYP
jgi:hypothetical protein